MLNELIQGIVGRHARQQEERDEFYRLADQPHAGRVLAFRRGLAIALVLIGLIAFIEVVALPGKMIRRNLVQDSESSDDQPPVSLPMGFMNEEQRKRQLDLGMQRVATRFREDQAQLAIACNELDRTWQDIEEAGHQKLRVTQGSNFTIIPVELAEAIAYEPTARGALGDLQHYSVVVQSALKQKRTLLSAVDTRTSNQEFLLDDDRDLRAASVEIEQLQRQLAPAVNDISHLATIERARAALVRTPPDPTSKGDPQ